MRKHRHTNDTTPFRLFRYKYTLLLLCICFCFHSLFQRSHAFPSAPGSCGSGKAVGGKHAINATGSIEEGGYEFLMNGIVLTHDEDFSMKVSNNSNKVMAMPTTSTSSSLSLPWEIRTKSHNDSSSNNNNVSISTVAETSFRGFLARFSGINNSNALEKDSLIIHESSSHLAKVYSSSTFLPRCEVGVVAAGHTSREEKQSVTGEIQLELDSGDLLLELTIVAANNIEGNRWYYSSYRLSRTEETNEDNSETICGWLSKLMGGFFKSVLKLVPFL